MKIAVPSDGNNLDSKVADRFSSARYVLIIDADSEEFETVPNPFTAGQHGAGIQAIVLAVSKGAKAVLTGYTSPAVANQFKSAGIEVITGMTGTVRDAVSYYRKFSPVSTSVAVRNTGSSIFDRGVFIHAVRTSGKQFLALLPIMLGVVLLTGLLDAFVSRELITSIFSGNVIMDTLWGALFGSIFAGNPVNSYIIGGELQKYGVSLFAITAFILSWVTVGLVQLPAEIAAFGKRFALVRNGFSFVLAIPIAIITVLILNLVTGWAF